MSENTLKETLVKLQNSDGFYLFINIIRILSVVGIIALLVLFLIYHEEILNATAPCSMCLNKGYICKKAIPPVSELGNITIMNIS